MSDTTLAYLISLGTIAFGTIWIATGTNSPTSAIWMAIGVLTIAVGMLSLLTEVRNRTH